MRYVRETKGGQSTSAWVILRGSKHVATVQAYHAASGGVLVNVFNHRKGEAQAGHAGGYGYDKFTAALAGLTIDGHKMTDHCQEKLDPPKGRKVWARTAKAPRGYAFANYHAKHLTFGFDPKKHLNPNFMGQEGWTSCYRESGLDYLKALGYRVISAI